MMRFMATMLLTILLAAQAMAQVQLGDPAALPPRGALLYDDSDLNRILPGLDGDATQYEGILLDFTAGAFVADPSSGRLTELTPLWSDSGIFRLPPDMQIESPTILGLAYASRSYELGVRDRTGTYLDGGKGYPLTVPLPVPAELFWGVTAYDPYTRSELQSKALGSLFQLKGVSPADPERQWIDTISGRGFLLYFSLQRSKASRKPGDSEVIDRSN